MGKNDSTLAKNIEGAIDKIYSLLINRRAVERLTKALEIVEKGKKKRRNVVFARITNEMLDEINEIRNLQEKTLLSRRNVIAFANAINYHLGKHLKEYGSSRKVAEAAFKVLTGENVLVLPGNQNSKGTVLVNKNKNRFADSVVLGDTKKGKTSLKDISPRSTKEIQRLKNKTL